MARYAVLLVFTASFCLFVVLCIYGALMEGPATQTASRKTDSEMLTKGMNETEAKIKLQTALESQNAELALDPDIDLQVATKNLVATRGAFTVCASKFKQYEDCKTNVLCGSQIGALNAAETTYRNQYRQKEAKKNRIPVSWIDKHCPDSSPYTQAEAYTAKDRKTANEKLVDNTKKPKFDTWEKVCFYPPVVKVTDCVIAPPKKVKAPFAQYPVASGGEPVEFCHAYALEGQRLASDKYQYGACDELCGYQLPESYTPASYAKALRDPWYAQFTPQVHTAESAHFGLGFSYLAWAWALLFVGSGLLFGAYAILKF